MALGQDKSLIHTKGGGKFYINDDLEETTKPWDTTPVGWEELGFIDEEGTQIEDQTDYEEKHDETGALVKQVEGYRTVTLTVPLLQTSAAEIGLLDTARTARYQCAYVAPVDDDTKEQRWHFPDCQILPNFTMRFAAQTVRILEVQVKAFTPDGGGDPYTVSDVTPT